MLLFRSAAVAAILFLLSASNTFSQDCGLGCGGGLNLFGCKENKRCLTADQLWAGYENQINCKGCVKTNKLNLALPGFGGIPNCRINSCGKETCASPCARAGLGLGSIHWPRPLSLGRNACAPNLLKGIQLGIPSITKSAPCDSSAIGKLGESRQQPIQPEPVETAPGDDPGNRPVSPIVAPVPLSSIQSERTVLNRFPEIESDPINEIDFSPAN